MVTRVLTKLPHRWRNIGFLFALCIIIYTTFQYIERSSEDDEDYFVLKRKDTLRDKSTQNTPFFSKKRAKTKYPNTFTASIILYQGYQNSK